MLTDEWSIRMHKPKKDIVIYCVLKYISKGVSIC